MLQTGTDLVNAEACVVCGASSLKEKVHFKPCPNSEALQQYLHSCTSFHGEIQDTDWLCHHCWKGQSAILEKMDSKHEIVSKDEDLKVLIDQIAKEAYTPRADESSDPSHLIEWEREKAVKVTALQLCCNATMAFYSLVRQTLAPME